jgi:hypothetical protein
VALVEHCRSGLAVTALGCGTHHGGPCRGA